MNSRGIGPKERGNGCFETLFFKECSGQATIENSHLLCLINRYTFFFICIVNPKTKQNKTKKQTQTHISSPLIQSKNFLSFYLPSSNFLIPFNDIGLFNWSVTIQTAKFNILEDKSGQISWKTQKVPSLDTL